MPKLVDVYKKGSPNWWRLIAMGRVGRRKLRNLPRGTECEIPDEELDAELAYLRSKPLLRLWKLLTVWENLGREE